MVDFVVLNELSLPVGQSVQEVKDNLKIFFELLRELPYNQVRFHKPLYELEAIQGEKFKEFMNKDRDTKTIINRLFANKFQLIKSPFLTDEEITLNELDRFEYTFNEEKSEGFAIADMFETFAISFKSKGIWKDTNIIVEKNYLLDSGDIFKESISINNISEKKSLEFFREILSSKLEDINIPKDEFWEKKGEIFKEKIKFCDEVEKQIEKIEIDVYNVFLEKLKKIEYNIKKYNEYKISGEGEAVKSNHKLKALRMFYHEDLGNEKIYFDSHIKSFPNGHRMYLLEYGDFIYIGYIGKHLPTKKFN